MSWSVLITSIALSCVSAIFYAINNDRVLFYALFKEFDEDKLEVVKVKIRKVFKFVFIVNFIILVIALINIIGIIDIIDVAKAEMLIGILIITNFGSLIVMCIIAYRLYNKFSNQKLKLRDWYTVLNYLDNKSYDNDIHSLGVGMKIMTFIGMAVIMFTTIVIPVPMIADSVIGVRVEYDGNSLNFGHILNFNDKVEVDDIELCETVSVLPPLYREKAASIDSEQKYVGTFGSRDDDYRYRLYVADASKDMIHIFAGNTHYYFNEVEGFSCK